MQYLDYLGRRDMGADIMSTSQQKKPMKLNNKYLLAGVTLLLAGILIYTFSEIVSYILIAWVVSMIGAPIVKFLRKYVGKNIAAGITLSLFVLLSMAILWIFIPPLSTQARNLSKINYTELINNLEEPISDWENWLRDRGLLAPEEETVAVLTEPEVDHIHTEVVALDSLLALRNGTADSTRTQQNITLVIKVDTDKLGDANAATVDKPAMEDTFFERFRKNLFTFLNPSRIPKLFTSIVGRLGNFIVGIFSVIFIAFFFLREQGLFDNMVSGVISDKYVNQSMQAISQTSTLLIRYFTGVLVQMTLITLFVSILLSILGVKNALLIGFFAALMNVIPYVGPIIGAGFAVIITVSSNLDLSFYDEMVPLILKVFGVFAIMQMLDNFILQPNIFSKSVKAHPLEIFIIVLVGAQVGGIGGMVLAIPVYTVLRVIAKVFLSEFKVVQSITKGL